MNLTGPNAIAFSNEDVVAPAKVLNDFAKDHEALEIKAGVIEGKLVTLDEVKAIATLPSREGLLSMLLSVLQAQSVTLHLLLKQLQTKRKSKALNFLKDNYVLSIKQYKPI